MQNVQLTTTQWLALPADIKTKLIHAFGISRSEGTVIQDNKVVSDGHNHRDLAVITLDKMQEFLNCATPDDEFYALFDQVVDKLTVENAYEPKVEDTVIPTPELVLAFGGKLYRAVEIGEAPANATVQPLYPTQPTTPGVETNTAPKPKATRAPRKKAKK